MYLWKYWRESRVTFAVSLLVSVLFFWMVLRQSNNDPTFSLGVGLAFPLSLIAWRFGSFGVGRSLAEGGGAYLLSRPRPRRFFVWNDWGFGLALLVVIVVLWNGLISWAGQLPTAHGAPRVTTLAAISVPAVVAMNCVTNLLVVGLVFGLTYLSTVAIKLRGLMLSGGILIGYLIARTPVHHYWPSIELPSLILSPFAVNTARKMDYAGHLGTSIALRLALDLVFPFAAMLLLQKRDVE